MSTRSKSREELLGHVLRCDIEKNFTCILSLRKHGKWFYISIVPGDIENDHLRGQYERRASAAREQQIAYQDFCNGESEGKDSGYASDDESEELFQDWIQQSLKNVFKEHAYGSKKTHQSLQDWYETEILCFSLKASSEDEELQASPRDDLDGEAFLHDTITPNVSLPKYIRQCEELEWYSPADIEVLEECHNIHMPIHPTLVRVGEKTCFLKLAARGQEPAVKREIRFLADFKKKDLYGQGLRAPRLEGIVTQPHDPESRNNILGFLLSEIPQPCRPLTNLMTSEISESKRNGWAKEVEKQVAILHKHKMLWGDAKADNFLVDREDKLWIIDFGGSFTVGWMDPEKYGTRRGEDEAVKLIVNGVKDPDNCTEGLVGETDEKPPSQSEEARKLKAKAKVAKRKRIVEEEGEDSGSKRQKKQT